jgi:hypothetical protein
VGVLGEVPWEFLPRLLLGLAAAPPTKGKEKLFGLRCVICGDDGGRFLAEALSECPVQDTGRNLSSWETVSCSTEGTGSYLKPRCRSCPSCASCSKHHSTMSSSTISHQESRKSCNGQVSRPSSTIRATQAEAADSHAMISTLSSRSKTTLMRSAT